VTQVRVGGLVAWLLPHTRKRQVLHAWLPVPIAMLMLLPAVLCLFDRNWYLPARSDGRI